ncbi:MAG: crotonase/enoyl-CoA hydratase family protein [Candidatus Nitrotoga sp.]
MGILDVIPQMENLLDIEYAQLSTRFDAEQGVLWTFMNPRGVPCYNLKMLDELLTHYKRIENSGGEVLVDGKFFPIQYVVYASKFPGIFNLGGELALFSQLIRKRDYSSLLHYATLCIDVVMAMVNHYRVPVTTITLIQGDALGGGFEAALTSDIIIAERGSKMGFPEILFNLFPGMGAYSFLVRKLGTIQAERMILSGKMYSAEELHELGLVDILVEDGKGEAKVLEYIQRQSFRRDNGYRALQQARQRVNPVTHAELMDITTIWARAALQLTENDLKMMDRLARSQQKLYGLGETKISSNQAAPLHQANYPIARDPYQPVLTQEMNMLLAA